MPVREWIDMLGRLDISPPSVKAVGVRLALYADWKTGAKAHPGVDLLASVTGFSERAVRRALEQLRSHGLLERTYRGSTAGRRALADEYQLTKPADLLDRLELLPLTREHRAR
jgi:hypothetical protein